MLLFFILNIVTLCKNQFDIEVKNDLQYLLNDIEGIYREDKEDKKVDINGNTTLFLNEDIKLIKLRKKGYVDKGYVLSAGKNVIQMEPKRATLQGNISGKSIILKNVVIELLDEKKTTLSKSISDYNGVFKFENIPVLRDYYLSVRHEGFIPYLSKKINLKERSRYFRNIYLKIDEIFFIFDVKYENGDIASKIKVTLENIEKETDRNGIVVFRVASHRKKVMNVEVSGLKFSIESDLKEKYISNELTIPF